MKYLILFLSLMFTVPSAAETVIIPVSDLMIEVSNYEAPKLNLGSAVNGQYSIDKIKKIKRDPKIAEKKLIDIAWTYFPEAKSIKIYKGNLIIKCP